MNHIIKTVAIGFAMLSFLGLGLYVIGVFANLRLTHLYLIWNLFLAWIPFGLSVWVHHLALKRTRIDWRLIVVGIVWVLFLPNTFYMVTDFIHITEVRRVDSTFDSVMFTVIITTGIGLGFASLGITHTTLLKYFNAKKAQSIIVSVIAASSFAIYLGRELRWNSWDIVTNPFLLLRDTASIILHPGRHFAAYTTTITFFIVVLTCYLLGWYFIRSLKAFQFSKQV